MQISRPTIPPAPMSVLVAFAPAAPAPSQLSRLRDRLRWFFDIDDGAGGIVAFVCVLAVFGTLMVRLVQLDRSLDSQQLSCTAVDSRSLQMSCEFK